MLRAYYIAYLIYRGFTGDSCVMDDDIAKLLELHEGREIMPYTDTVGKITIGVGHNLTDNGLSSKIIDALLEEDIEIARKDLDGLFPEWCNLSRNRQLVLLDMCFNLGGPRYFTFRRFWGALEAEDYDLAAEEMKDSRWFKQVGGRGERLHKMMVDG